MFNKHKNVAAVLADFNKTIADLNAIVEREKEKQASLEAQANRIREHKLASLDECGAAERISKKLADLVS